MATKKKQTKSEKKEKTTPKKTSPKTKGALEPAPAVLPRKKNRSFPIIGIGASAGGLEAFEMFFRNMPENSGMAFVLVPHLDPKHISILPDLIQKYTKMTVLQVTDGTKVQPNVVYVIPHNRTMAIMHGTLYLIEQPDVPSPRLPIDYFLRSLAEDQTEKAICIILSGTGTDGMLGLKAIKGELGMAMVQDPDSARYDGMPKSAIGTGLVDYILPPDEMPGQLIAYTKRFTGRQPPKISPTLDTPNALQKVFVLLRAHTGHDFSLYKKNTICRRIERRIHVHQIDSISNYVRYLQKAPEEVSSLFKELLIGVTNFFRDPTAFEALKKKALLPMLAGKPGDEPIRIWVPGCSSGEEAYSAAIITRECLEEMNRFFSVQIFATDIDSEAIENARSGIYPESITADVSPDRLKKYFLQEESRYRVVKDIREMIVFAPQDVIKDPPFTKLDMICCRNLLIYLDTELQKKLLPLFHYSLNDKGILFLGTSETVGGFVDLFSAVDQKAKVFRRRQTALGKGAPLEFPIKQRQDDELELIARELKQAKKQPLATIIQKILIDSYAPPCVIINEEGDILYIHGRTGRYLEPAPGEATLSILEMAREGLKKPLLSGIHRAKTHRGDVVQEGVRIKYDGEDILTNLKVRNLQQAIAEQNMMMVIFEDFVSTPKDLSKPTHRSRRVGAKRAEKLEQELNRTREDLQTSIEELETSNEELKSTNEELQSTNEELQSTNEEMETSKEELQSLNEELVTVNAELQGKIDELSTSNNDMKNLLNSSDIPTLFLNDDLSIKRFTTSAAKIINVIDTDIGRPIHHLVSNLRYKDLVADAKQVLNDLAFRETEVQTKDGRWYLMRILPYRTVDNVIDGLVINFMDIHHQKRAGEELQKLNQALEENKQLFENIFNTVREPFLILDKSLKIISANRAFYKIFNASPSETEKHFIYNLGNGQWDIPQLRVLLEEIIPKDHSFEGFEVEHKFPKIGLRKMLLNARRVFGKEISEEKILLALEDVTGKS